MSISAQQFRELLDRYLNGTASPKERELLDKFFESYQTGLSDLGVLENNQQLQQEILQKIYGRIAFEQKPAGNRMLRLWLPMAACMLLFVLSYFFMDSRVLPPAEQHTAPVMMEEKTSRGEKLSVKLPDGTSVYLNAGSKISYPKSFDEKSRDVTITGEVYFEVVKDVKPFVVHTNQVKTEVLGTSFNVKNIPGGNVEVTLVEGKLNIVSPSGSSSILKPNQQAIVASNTSEIITKEVNILRYTSWKDNILYFDQTTLKEAIETLESWYAVNIDILNPELEKCMITARYQDEPIGNVLSSFQFLLNLDIAATDEGHNIKINGKGCK